MCELLETDLKLRGYDAIWFTSATDALAALRDNEVDVVLTDVRMPGTSGLQLCQQISTTYPSIPVIVMTAFGSMETA
ncbi:MAG: response regulator, partial [Planctomycetales bacterium]|nr:response regulator [Planctomycetales bacterium]